MNEAKQIVYRYDGDEKSEEVEFDRDGEVRIPKPFEIINRKGKEWKVVHIITEQNLAQGAVPVYRIFLSSSLSPAK